MFCNTSISLLFSLSIVCYQRIYETATGADLGLAIISPGGVCLGGGGQTSNIWNKSLKSEWLKNIYMYIQFITEHYMYIWSSLQ